MLEPFLDGAGVVPIVGERKAAGMAQHGHMDRAEGLAANPITASCFLNRAAVIGEWRSVVNREGEGDPARVAGGDRWQPDGRGVSMIDRERPMLPQSGAQPRGAALCGGRGPGSSPRRPAAGGATTHHRPLEDSYPENSGSSTIETSRRDVLVGGAVAALATALSVLAPARQAGAATPTVAKEPRQWA
jgi:hypothetical protein